MTGRTHPGRHLASSNTRGLKARWCATCSQPILTGIDEDQLGWPATCDPTPIDAYTEAAARLDGRLTYTLTIPLGKTARITRRDRYSIKRWPAGNPRRRWHTYNVIPEHVCFQPLPAISSLIAPTPTDLENDDAPCPF